EKVLEEPGTQMRIFGKPEVVGHRRLGVILATADTVEEAIKAGVTAIIQPGGSIKDKLSIEECDKNGIAMVFTGTRHFKH
ncbi:MAG: hypothetical protein HUJ54_06040, partial [Erysipelotrichaceae bacterium]|nr:hypothetical protein [Erysipelotrichaceae bacterium]